MVKTCRLKAKTKVYRKRRSFFGRRPQDLNNIVNTVNNELNTVNNSVNNSVNTELEATIIELEEAESSSGNIDSVNKQSCSSATSSKIETFEASTPKEKNGISGYRIVDTEILSNVFSVLLCPICTSNELFLGERATKKQGVASCLYVKCSNCSYTNQFYSSKTTNSNNSFVLMSIHEWSILCEHSVTAIQASRSFRFS